MQWQNSKGSKRAEQKTAVQPVKLNMANFCKFSVKLTVLAPLESQFARF